MIFGSQQVTPKRSFGYAPGDVTASREDAPDDGLRINQSDLLSISLRRKSGELEAVQVHYLVPGCHEVFHELLLRVSAGVDFRKRPQLGV